MFGVFLSIIGAAIAFIGPIYIVEVLEDQAREKLVREAKRNARRWSSPLLDK